MLIAREKYKTNIVEYILYMFNIEDVIRANKLDITLLEKAIISKYNLPEKQIDEIRQWYIDLIAQMIKDDVQETGHISSIRELIFKLNDLHIELLNSLDQERYLELYHWATDYIKELKSKMNHPEMTEIEVCLNGLYAFMLMKMKGLEVTMETSEAMGIFSQMMRFLSKKYMERFLSV
jgi:flagellin-specific chaperone FliS